jgi:hypothetical protein
MRDRILIRTTHGDRMVPGWRHGLWAVADLTRLDIVLLHSPYTVTYVGRGVVSVSRGRHAYADADAALCDRIARHLDARGIDADDRDPDLRWILQAAIAEALDDDIVVEQRGGGR